MALFERIRGYGLVEGSMSLRMGFEVSKAQARLDGSLFLLSKDPDVKLSATCPARCLSACHHASCHSGDGLDLSEL